MGGQTSRFLAGPAGGYHGNLTERLAGGSFNHLDGSRLVDSKIDLRPVQQHVVGHIAQSPFIYTGEIGGVETLLLDVVSCQGGIVHSDAPLVQDQECLAFAGNFLTGSVVDGTAPLYHCCQEQQVEINFCSIHFI